MFLDEKLYNAGLKIKPDYSNDIEIIKNMLWICIDESQTILTKGNYNDYELYPLFKRLNTSWNIAIDKLNKQGKHFVKKNGFIEYLLLNEDFKVLHPIIKKIIK
jgi:hypothetical protein